MKHKNFYLRLLRRLGTHLNHGVWRELANIKLNLERILKRMATIDEQLTGIESKLTEASSEILAEIEKLKSRETLSAEGQATLDRIAAKANALADIVPNTPENGGNGSDANGSPVPA